MRKIISILVLIAIVFMLEFNGLKTIISSAYQWIEPLAAFIVLIGLFFWNDLHKK